MSSNCQFRIQGISAVGMPDQSGLAVMAALPVRRIKGVDQQRPETLAGQIITGAHPHGTRADDNDVIRGVRTHRDAPSLRPSS
ncbi:hypothetical protein D3C81_1291610 [compost metagenome]